MLLLRPNSKLNPGVQMKNVWIVVLMLMAGKTTAAQSTVLPTEDVGGLMQKVSSVQETIKEGLAKDPPNCKLGSLPDCSFSSLCSAIVANRNKPYVYQDPQGHKYPNYTLMEAYDDISQCTSKPGFAKLGLEQDPFLNQKLYSMKDTSAAGAQYKKEYQAEWPRLQKRFEEAREKVIQVLQVRRTADNKSQIDSMIARVKSVKVQNFYDFKPGELAKDTNCDRPNSEYIPDVDKVMICPQLLEWPDGTLFGLFSHELGHSFDECSLMRVLTKDSRGSGPLLLGRGFDAKSGVIGNIIPMEKNPFRTVFACFQKKDSLSLQSPDPEAIKAQIQAEIDKGHQDGENNDDDDMQAKFRALHDADDNLQGVLCDRDTDLKRESFADWVSSQAVSLKLQETKDEAEAKRLALESQMHLLELGCAKLQNNQAGTVIKTMREAHCAATDDVHWLFDRKAIPKELLNHPLEEDRVSKIFMAQPAFQKALSCQPLSAPSCQ